VDWVKPVDLTVLHTQQLKKHAGGKITLARSPQYVADVAIRIARAN
jgi:hypothetical protein